MAARVFRIQWPGCPGMSPLSLSLSFLFALFLPLPSASAASRFLLPPLLIYRFHDALSAAPLLVLIRRLMLRDSRLIIRPLICRLD